MTDDEIVGAMAEVCGQLNAAHARLVSLVAAAIETQCWAGAGIHSCEHWVAWQTGCSRSRARQLVALARRLADLPAASAAFSAGELSVDQVAVVARHTPPDHDRSVTELAKLATVSQLERTLPSYAFPAPSSAPAVPDEPAPTFVAGWFDDGGRYQLRAALDAADGALVDAALREAQDRLFRRDGTPATGGEALVEVARGSLAGVAPIARRDAFTALFHVRLDDHAARLHRGPALPDALRRQLLCDGHGAIVGLRDGRPVSVGRHRRIVPTRTRRVVEDRDQGCRVPGCDRRHVEIHHIVHWEDGGSTDTANLVSLCGKHHRLHHQGLLGIDGDADAPDGLLFRDRYGHPLPGAPPPRPPGPHGAIPVTGRWAHPTGETLHRRWVHFRPDQAVSS